MILVVLALCLLSAYGAAKVEKHTKIGAVLLWCFLGMEALLFGGQNILLWHD